MAFTLRQQKFIKAFAGNATEACRKAGYWGDDATLATQGWRLLRNAEVRAAIDAREEGAFAPIVLTREERQEAWSRIASDPREKTADRLKALEMLGRSQADFTEKLEVKGELTLLELVKRARSKK